MFQIGDLVRFADDRFEAGMDNFFGVVIQIDNSFYNNLVYYKVRWLDTGDSYGYEECEIEKVTGE
jgi:hypothetical protein